MKNFKRIIVIGSPGTGKTDFSARLAEVMGLPHVHMDHYAWKPKWKRRTNDEIIALIKPVHAEDEWISDGIYVATLEERLKNADLLIFMDANPFVCAWRVIKRWAKGGSYQAPGCPSKVDYTFLKYILWVYPRQHKKQLLNRINALNNIPTIKIYKYDRSLDIMHYFEDV